MKNLKTFSGITLVLALAFAMQVSAEEVTGTLTSGLGSGSTITGTIGGDTGGSTTGGTIGGGIGGSTTGGTIGGGIGGSTTGGTIGGTTGNTIEGTVTDGSGGGGGGSSGGGGGSVLGDSTGGSSSGSGTDGGGEVLGVGISPGFPYTGLGEETGGGNLLGSIMILSSLVLYTFYRATKNA